MREVGGQTEAPENLELPVASPPDAADTLEHRRGGQLLRWGIGFYAAMAAVALAWREGWYDEPILYVSAEAARRGMSPGSDPARNLSLRFIRWRFATM